MRVMPDQDPEAVVDWPKGPVTERVVHVLPRRVPHRWEPRETLSFTVPGEPVPKGRARVRIVSPKAGKPFAVHYTPGDTEAYEATIRTLCQITVNLARWTWTAKDRFRVVVRVFRQHEGKGGDWDNYGKAACDAMNGIAYADDRHVRQGGVTVMQDPNPRLEIVVTKLEADHGKAAT